MLELNSLAEQRRGAEEETGRQDEEGHQNTETTAQIIRVQGKSPMELLVMYCPLYHLTCFLYPGLYFISLDMSMLLISVFPVESRNFLTIFLCLAWEIFIFSVIFAWATYVIFTIVSFVLTLTDTADLVMSRLSIR